MLRGSGLSSKALLFDRFDPVGPAEVVIHQLGQRVYANDIIGTGAGIGIFQSCDRNRRHRRQCDCRGFTRDFDASVDEIGVAFAATAIITGSVTTATPVVARTAVIAQRMKVLPQPGQQDTVQCAISPILIGNANASGGISR